MYSDRDTVNPNLTGFAQKYGKYDKYDDYRGSKDIQNRNLDNYLDLEDLSENDREIISARNRIKEIMQSLAKK